MSVLIIAEHDNKTLNKSTLNTIAAGQVINEDVHVLVVGSQCNSVVTELSAVLNVSKVLVADNEAYKYQLPENTSLLIKDLSKSYTHIVAAATTSGKNVMPRVAALLNVEQISDVIDIVNDDTFKRPIYAGNAIAKVQSSASIKVITVRTTAFDPVASKGGNAMQEEVDVLYESNTSSFVKEELASSERPELITAGVVISGGRGMANGENFEMLYKLADKLGAAVGASRAAVDAGFVPNDMQVGQTGKIVAPELYIAVGISGAIQHLAGMKDSKIIVAINKDEDAPIFQIADYGLVADLFEVIPELTEIIA